MNVPEPNAFDVLIDGPDDSLDLARIALTIAGDEYPGIQTDTYVKHLDALAQAARNSTKRDASEEELLLALNRQLFDVEGFSANKDAYYDPRNSFLNEVLDRRLGIPITLSVVYLEVGWRLGLSLVPVSFPAHFLVATTGDQRIFIDPFNQGARLREEELVSSLVAVLGTSATNARAYLPQATVATPRREVVARILRNLKAIYANQRDLERLLAVSNRIVVLNPNDADAVRDRGHVLFELECHQAANQDYVRYLQLAPDADDAANIAARSERLRRKSTRLN